MAKQTKMDFESETSKALRFHAYAESNHPQFLEEARRIARHCCYANLGMNLYQVPNTVTSDYVRIHMFVEVRIDGKNNIMGSVFKKGFVRVGFVSSKAEGSHGTIRRLWTMPQYEISVRKFMAAAA